MAETTFTELHGKYSYQNKQRRIYTGSSAAGGIALIAPATGGGHPTLFLPSSSTRNVSLVRLEVSYVSGNNAPVGLQWAYTLAAGAAAATGAAILTAVAVNPVGMLGGSLDNKAIWSPTTNTFTAAPTFFRSAGLSLFTGVAATAAAPFTMRADYDGDFMIAPGTAVSLTTQGATTTSLFQVSVTWEEIDAA